MRQVMQTLYYRIPGAGFKPACTSDVIFVKYANLEFGTLFIFPSTVKFLLIYALDNTELSAISRTFKAPYIVVDLILLFVKLIVLLY